MVSERFQFLKNVFLALGLIPVLMLMSGCTTNTHTGATTDGEISKNLADYDADSSLMYYEEQYKTQSHDEGVVYGYGQALRRTGDPQKALVVLSAMAKKRKANPAIVLEYAASNAQVGRYDVAQKYAENLTDNEQFSARAWHIIGVALDAQGHHKKAETAYRKALSQWEGDPVPVMNNLALSLAHQGFFDESLETIRKAHALAPDREDVKRNMEIVQELRDTVLTRPN